MWRLGLLGLGFLTLLPAAGNAQWGSSYNRGYSYYRPAPQYGFFSWWDNDDDEFYRPRSRGPSQQSGGARPAIAPQAPASIDQAPEAEPEPAAVPVAVASDPEPEDAEYVPMSEWIEDFDRRAGSSR